MSSPENSQPQIIESWNLFANNKEDLRKYQENLSVEAVRKLTEGAEPEPGEEIYTPYLRAIGEWSDQKPSNQ